MWEMNNCTKNVAKPGRNRSPRRSRVCGRINLKWTLKKYNVRQWAGLNWFRILEPIS
jgi:hypothetical protein